MINYSITARAVNNNLFEINQAKARIAQAKAEGKTPDTKDEALVETVVTNYFATAQYTEVMGIEKFARTSPTTARPTPAPTSWRSSTWQSIACASSCWRARKSASASSATSP